MFDTIKEVVQKGGPFMIMNIVCLAVVIAIIIERAIYFLGRGHINTKAFLEQIKRLLASNNLDRAKKLCDATTAPVARVAKAGLNRLHRGEAAVAQAMEETMTDTLPEVKTRIGALWSLANIVTLIGHVSLTQGPNVTTGDKLIYNLNSGVANVYSAPGTPVKSLFVQGSQNGAGEAKGAATPDKSAPAKPQKPTPGKTAKQQ